MHQTKRHEHSTAQHPTAPAQAEPICYKKHSKSAPEEIFGEQMVFLTSLLHELMQKKNQTKTQESAWHELHGLADRHSNECHGRTAARTETPWNHNSSFPMSWVRVHPATNPLKPQLPQSSCWTPADKAVFCSSLPFPVSVDELDQAAVSREHQPLSQCLQWCWAPAQPHLSQGMELIKFTCQGALSHPCHTIMSTSCSQHSFSSSSTENFLHLSCNSSYFLPGAQNLSHSFLKGWGPGYFSF